MKVAARKKEFIIGAVLLATYLIFNGILLMGHELWRDEANVWLIARDMTPLQLLREIKYQGHPCLWYLIAMPFAKIGLPFQTLSVLSFIVMGVAASVFVYKAPFHPLTKAVCLLSPMMSYYYPVVARNYCLIALILILLAYFYPRRNEKSVRYGLLLGLLVQTDTIALASAGLISMMWFCECVYRAIKEKSCKPLIPGIKGLWIPLASLFLWIYQFHQISDSPEYRMKILSLEELLREIRNFSYHILSRMTGQGETFGQLLILLFLIAGILLSVKKKNVWPMLVMLGAFLLEVIFSIMVYQLHIWHYIALCYSLIWCFWMGCDNNAEEAQKKYVAIAGSVLAEVMLILLGVTMFIRWNSPEENSSLANAWNGLYSDGVHTAEYIENYVAAEELIVSTDVVEAATVQAYLGSDYRFYFAGNGKTATYASYTEDESQTITYEMLVDWIKNTFPEKAHFYLLVSPTSCVEEISEEVKGKWELCYQTTEETARGEEYNLYKIGLQE